MFIIRILPKYLGTVKKMDSVTIISN